MKKFILSLLILISVFTLVGCGNESEYLLKEGEVYSKEFRETYDVIGTVSGYSGTWKTTYPDAYIIYVKYKEDFGDADNAFYKTFAFYVSKDIYNKVNIGDKYLYNSEKDSLNFSYSERVSIDE